MKIDIDDIVDAMLEDLDVDQLLFLANKLDLSHEYLTPSVEEEWLGFNNELREIIFKALRAWIENEKEKPK